MGGRVFVVASLVPVASSLRQAVAAGAS